MEIFELEDTGSTLCHKTRERIGAELAAKVISIEDPPSPQTIATAASLCGRPDLLTLLLSSSLEELAAKWNVPILSLEKLKAAVRLTLHLLRGLEERPTLDNSRKVYSHFAHLGLTTQEVFYVVSLSARNTLLSTEMVAKGTGNLCVLAMKDILSPVLRCGAGKAILVHNHPSGNPDPSPEDIEVTMKVCRCCNLVGISLLDHVIVGRGGYYSMADSGLLREERG